MVIFATVTVLAFVLLCNSSFNFHCYTQREATPTQKFGPEVRCDLLRLLCWKITKHIHSSKPASLNRPIAVTVWKMSSAIFRNLHESFGMEWHLPWSFECDLSEHVLLLFLLLDQQTGEKNSQQSRWLLVLSWCVVLYLRVKAIWHI